MLNRLPALPGVRTGLLSALSLMPLETVRAEGASGNRFEDMLKVRFVQDDGAAARLMYASELRMLGQRVATAACAYHAGIAGEEGRALLAEATALFDRIIEGLEVGDEELGIIGAETDRMILKDIKAVHDIWDPLHEVIDAIIAGERSMEHVETIVGDIGRLKTVTQHMVSVVSGEYSDPSILLQGDAITLDFVGRQEMLLQEIAKDICLILIGYSVDETRAEMSSALSTFDLTLNALTNGMPEAGIAPPPSDDVQAKLELIRREWDAMAPMLTRIADGDMPTAEEKGTSYAQLNDLTDRMTALSHLYAKASDLGL